MFNFVRKHDKFVAVLDGMVIVSSGVNSAIQFQKGETWLGLICLVLAGFVLIKRKQSKIIESYEKDIVPGYKKVLDDTSVMLDGYEKTVTLLAAQMEVINKRIREHVDDQLAEKLLKKEDSNKDILH